MKRTNSIFELFVLVIFFHPSVANPPMWGGCGSSSSSAVEESEPCIYGLNSLRRWTPNGERTWQNPRIYIENYNDAAEFKYKLLGAYNELAYENTGPDTNLAFFYGTRMKIRAGDIVNGGVSYDLDFEQDNEANLVAEYMLSTDSARFKKCTGSNAYKLEKVYQTSPPMEVGENLCIFKIPTSSATKFVMRRTTPIGDQPLTLCVFRSMEYGLATVRSDRLELRLYWHGNIVEPRYVLELSKPYKLREFFRST